MRKLSILALVVILAGALSIGAYAASDNGNATVEFGANEVISLKIKDGKNSTDNVDFGSDLDPFQDYYAINATTLSVKSSSDKWEVTHSMSGGPTQVLSLDYDGHLNGKSKFNSDTSYQGTQNGEWTDVEVSYKLHDLEDLDNSQGKRTLSVEFTVTNI